MYRGFLSEFLDFRICKCLRDVSMINDENIPKLFQNFSF